jgi:hypothetical protein
MVENLWEFIHHYFPHAFQVFYSCFSLAKLHWKWESIGQLLRAHSMMEKDETGSKEATQHSSPLLPLHIYPYTLCGRKILLTNKRQIFPFSYYVGVLPILLYSTLKLKMLTTINVFHIR